MASSDPAAGDQPVALVVQRRIADEGFAAFTYWTGRVADELKSWPGFLDQEVIPPRPPAHPDWLHILRFATPGDAHAWLQSDVRARLIEDIQHHFMGPENAHILPESGNRRAGAVSAVISFSVPPNRVTEFLAWQARVQAVEAEFKGFLRHKVERPIPGLHDDWIIILSFDNDANLNAWMESPQRRALVEDGWSFNTNLTVTRAGYGFNFWFPAGQATDQSPTAIFKSNLIVLLVLYPAVFLWNYFIGAPLLDAHGVPFWLALFIGNVASTQLLGWWIAPAAFKKLDWWMQSGQGWKTNLLGYGLLTVSYVLSMAVYAALLAWNWGKG